MLRGRNSHKIDNNQEDIKTNFFFQDEKTSLNWDFVLPFDAMFTHLSRVCRAFSPKYEAFFIFSD